VRRLLVLLFTSLGHRAADLHGWKRSGPFRMRSGMAARARGARIGRPRKFVGAERGAELRSQGSSWRAIARELAVGFGTVRRAARGHSRNDSLAPAASG
jgi:hypothetical protein